jgi:hypothetical protein
MSFKKKLLAITAAGALTAVAAVPAMALENEFHGMLGIRAINSNYHVGGGTGYLNITGDSATTKNYVEQRARLFYTAKANDNLKLVTGFEIDSTWGKSSYTVGRANEGGALGADTVNLETKWVYLDFNCPLTGTNVKAGIQGLNDAYKGVFVGGGADAAGIQLSKGFGPVTFGLGWFRLDDRTTTASTTTNGVNNGYIVNASGNTANVAFTDGKKTRDLFITDIKVSPSKELKLGASYYYVNSDNAQTDATQALATSVASGTGYDYDLHVLGFNAAVNAGPASIDMFGLYEFGAKYNLGSGVRSHINSFAGNVAAKVKAGSAGTFKVNGLYINGGTNAFVSINNETSAASSESALGGAFGNMFILVRNSYLTTNDQYLVYDSSNKNQGLVGGSIGFDANLTSKVFLNTNVGFAAVAKDTAVKPVRKDSAGTTTNASNYLGTEANVELGAKVYDGLTASIRGAYVWLGDYYHGTATSTINPNPANPYTATIALSYTF